MAGEQHDLAEEAAPCQFVEVDLGDSPEVHCHVLTLSTEDAFRAVADTRYGLSAAVFTNRLDESYEFIDRIDAGQVAVNLPTSGWDVHLPFGGFRESGSAFKEQGAQALQFYTRTKTVAIKHRTSH